ncbi:MAG: hypothetical protein EOL92_00475 [Bacteroidia bacterium]|nr:hypothetical protein [Bacteroidia bacterium]
MITNGLRAEATEAEAWEFHKQLQAGGVSYVGPERAEAAPGQQRSAEPPPQPAPQAPAVDPVEAIKAALAADRQRAAEIEDVCTIAGMEPQAIRSLVVAGTSVDEARKAALEHIRKTSVPFGPGAASGAQVGLEAPEKFRAAALDGLLMRCGRTVDKPADGAREFRGMRMLDIVRECLELSGVRTRGMDPRAIASRALTAASTSDFANLLGALVNKTLIGAYNEAPATWRVLVARSDASDFKTKYAIKLSGAPDLVAKNENGEFQTAEFSDSKESYGISTRGRIIRLTREMIINDDLGGFNRIATAFGYAARRWENSVVYGLLTANGNMSDGNALFSSAHNNTLTAAALSADALGTARAKMRRQTGMKGEKLDVLAAYILTGPELETTAEILLRSPALPTATMSAGVYNPWAGKLTPVSDPLITDTNAWYLFANPAMYPVLEVAWLMGEEQPYIEEEAIFAADSIGILVRHDFGAGVVDHVGAVYNEGA